MAKRMLIDATHPEGTEVHLNGIRLTPDYGSSAEADYAVDAGTSTLTFLRPLRVGDIVGVTLLVPPESPAPGAMTVRSLKLTPAAPDGATNAFALATRAAGGPAVSLSKAEELLVSLDGVIQEPGVAYVASADTLTFTTPPEISAQPIHVGGWITLCAPPVPGMKLRAAAPVVCPVRAARNRACR